MKLYHRNSILAVIALLGSGVIHASAANPTSTVVNGKVVDSTFTFTNIGTSGPGNFSLDQTTIPNLNTLSPPVELELELTNITYTEASVIGNGSSPTVSFDLVPTLGNVVSGYSPVPVTLTAPAIANGVTDTSVVFSLATPLTFELVDESNPGNTNEGTGMWQESLSNLEPTPDSITTTGGLFSPNSVQNQNFSFNGSVEVIYAVPEPSAWALAILCVGFFGFLRWRSARA
jgi:hypothetical protein